MANNERCTASGSNIIISESHHVGNRRHIPEPMKQQWVTMSAHMKSSDIARVTHSSHRTVNRVLRLSRLTGSVVQRPYKQQVALVYSQLSMLQ
jgi:hypothetical protein